MSKKNLRITLLFLVLPIIGFLFFLSITHKIQVSAKIPSKVIETQPISGKPSAGKQANYDTGTIIVKFKSPLQVSTSRISSQKSVLNATQALNAMPSSLRKVSSTYGIVSARPIFQKIKNQELAKLYLLQFKNTDSRAIASAFRKSSEVQYVDLNYKIEFFNTDPLFPDQWHLHNPTADVDIDALESFDLSAYGVTSRNDNVIVGIVDNPLYVEHDDLKNSVWINRAEIPADGLDNDGNGYIDDDRGCFFGHVDTSYNCGVNAGSPTILDHGTAVTGVIAASHNNIGIKGVCPNCKIMRAGVPYFYSNVLEAVAYSIDNGANVINMSWGYFGDVEGSTALQELFNYANSRNVVLVGANGNFGSDYVFSPAGMNHVIAVASLDENNQKASTSSYGERTDLSAPGQNILTTVHSTRYNTILNSYRTESGTSFASPIVAGAAGMLLAYDSSLTPERIKQILKETADPVIYRNQNEIGKLGAGRVNSFRALYKHLNLKEVFKGKDIVSVQCYGSMTRLEIRDRAKVLVNNKPAKHIVDNVYSAWVENGTSINITGTGWSSRLTVPTNCVVSSPNGNF